MVHRISELDPVNCVSLETIIGLKIPGHDWKAISPQLIRLEDKALLADAIRLWIKERGWAWSMTPYGDEYGIAIATSSGFHWHLSTSYITALLTTYIAALENDTKESIV